jgi:SNF2 family DNA or RNA helicase
LLHFIAPDEWPSRVKYLDRYADIQWNQWGGMDVHGLKPANAEEFHSLVDLRLLRRTKDLVLPWLPEKVYERRDVEMHPKQARAYKSFKERMVAELDGGTGMALSQLTLATRLTQMASAFGEINEDGDLRLCAPSSKIDELVELLAEMGEEPLVVFAQSRQLIGLAATRLEREGISYSQIVGGQSEDERTKGEQDFTEGRVRVILLTMGAGAEALSLTRASTVCFLQRSWSLVQNLQAENRNHRPGQENKVVIVDLVTPGTIEEAQQEAIRAKGERLEEIVQDRRLLLDI